jgi:hypothetical protein
VVDLLQASGGRVHLANPQGLNWGQPRVKNDERDAIDLADMLRLGRLPQAWIAPPAVRELRELVRYRAKLVALRSGLKARHSGVAIACSASASLSNHTSPTPRNGGSLVPNRPSMPWFWTYRRNPGTLATRGAWTSFQ